MFFILHQFIVDPNHSKLIFDYCDLHAVIFLQNPIKEGGLSRSQETRQNCYGDVFQRLFSYLSFDFIHYFIFEVGLKEIWINPEDLFPIIKSFFETVLFHENLESHEKDLRVCWIVHHSEIVVCQSVLS